jgi:hypothetical protein
MYGLRVEGDDGSASFVVTRFVRGTGAGWLTPVPLAAKQQGPRGQSTAAILLKSQAREFVDPNRARH